MKVRYFYLPIFFLLFSFACSNTSKIDPLLEEAHTLHKQAMAVQKEAKEILASLSASDNFRQETNAHLEAWSKQLPEVPGFEHDHHDHDHNHDHDHDHGPKLELTPEDMLLVQKEMLDSVKVIKDRILDYKQKLAPVQ